MPLSYVLLCMLEQMFVCMCFCYATRPRRFAFSHVEGFIYDPTVGSSQFFFEIHPAVTLSTNSRITLCSYYVHMSATLSEQLRTIVDNVMRMFLCDT